MADDLMTTNGQIQWGTLLLGERSPYAGRVAAGWTSRPQVDSGSVLRAQQHGGYPGRLLARERVITFDFELIPEDPSLDSLWPSYLEALEAAVAIEQAERPLVVQLAGRRLQVDARVTDFVMPDDRQFTRGNPRGTIEWTCSDPRRYGMTALSFPTGLPQSGSGLDWGDTSSPTGLDWHDGDSPAGLDWGTGGSSGDLAVTNAGTAPTHPLLEIRGPVVMPSIVLQETGQVLEYDLPLAASDVLTVDTAAGTVTLASGASRLYTVTARSSPEEAFVLPHGTSTISFRAAPGSSDPAASLTVRYRPAYW